MRVILENGGLWICKTGELEIYTSNAAAVNNRDLCVKGFVCQGIRELLENRGLEHCVVRGSVQQKD